MDQNRRRSTSRRTRASFSTARSIARRSTTCSTASASAKVRAAHRRVGAGKTTLCRALLEQLDRNYSTALILNPVLNADELMKAIATEFGLEVSGGPLERRGHQRISAQTGRERNRKRLIIDEAQNDGRPARTGPVFRTLRRRPKLLQIVLMGQPELRDRLNSPRLQAIAPAHHRALSSRAAHARRGGSIHPAPAGNFGRARRADFTRAALWRVYGYSQGYSAARECHLRQGIARGLRSSRVTESIIAWWAWPSANWKETFLHEPD